MSKEAETEIIICQCHSPEHQIIISYWPDDEPIEKMLYVQIHLANYNNFFKRLWAGLKYAFGHRCKYGHWDEVLLGVDEAKQLWSVLCDFIADKNTACSQQPAPDADWAAANTLMRQGQ